MDIAEELVPLRQGRVQDWGGRAPYVKPPHIPSWRVWMRCVHGLVIPGVVTREIIFMPVRFSRSKKSKKAKRAQGGDDEGNEGMEEGVTLK